MSGETPNTPDLTDDPSLERYVSFTVEQRRVYDQMVERTRELGLPVRDMRAAAAERGITLE